MVGIIAAKFLRTSAKSIPMLLAMVVFPLLMTFFMGLAMPPAVTEPVAAPKVTVAYFSADTGSAGQPLRDYLKGQSEWLELQEMDETGFRTAREDNAFAVAVAVPADFRLRYERGEAVSVEVIRGTGSQLEVSRVAGIVRGFTDRQNANLVRRQTGASGGLAEEYCGLTNRILLPQAPALPLIQYFAAANLVMFILLAGATGGIRLITEREDKTLLRVFAGPVTRSQILLGYLLGQFSVTLLQAALIILAGVHLFKIDWGNPAGLAGVTAATAFVATSLAFLFAYIFNSAKLAGGAVPVLVICMSFLSGGMTGQEGLSPALRQLSNFTLNKWAIEAYTGLMRGQGLTDIRLNLVVLFGTGAVITLMAGFLANRREAFYE